MLTIIQLEDGCYKITLSISSSGGRNSIHWEKTMREVKSDAMPKEGGEKILVTFGGDDK